MGFWDQVGGAIKSAGSSATKLFDKTKDSGEKLFNKAKSGGEKLFNKAQSGLKKGERFVQKTTNTVANGANKVGSALNSAGSHLGKVANNPLLQAALASAGPYGEAIGAGLSASAGALSSAGHGLRTGASAAKTVVNNNPLEKIKSQIHNNVHFV